MRREPRTLLEEIIAGKALTERELEVLQLGADGLSLQEIGDHLFLSIETIKGYRKRVIAKLEARNGIHATAIAIRRGLID